jgi:hypothetical protein
VTRASPHARPTRIAGSCVASATVRKRKALWPRDRSPNPGGGGGEAGKVSSKTHRLLFPVGKGEPAPHDAKSKRGRPG